jgi:hypothetical protein
MLFNGIELQKEFIRNKGIEALVHFLRKKEKMFQQLACKCFALLSENQDYLVKLLSIISFGLSKPYSTLIASVLSS